MSSNAELWQRRAAAVARGVSSATQLFAERAVNAEIWDVEGKRYIDFAGGIGVLNTGHRHPKVLAAIEQQLQRVIHSCFQVMPYEPYIALAEQLNAIAPIEGAAKTLLLSTGAEAVENAVKIARLATGRPGVIAFSGGFHGRTMMAMALTGKVAPYKIGFGPFPPTSITRASRIPGTASAWRIRWPTSRTCSSATSNPLAWRPSSSSRCRARAVSRWRRRNSCARCARSATSTASC